MTSKFYPNPMTEREILAEMEYLYRIVVDNEKYNQLELFLKDEIYTSQLGKIYYPRQLYPLHQQFWKAGAIYQQRMFLAGNRIAKTLYAAIELVFHLRGWYPDWWEGKRYSTPRSWWVCGDNRGTVKSVLQDLLLGSVGDFGSGIIPRAWIDFISLTDATKNATTIDSFKIKHVSGGFSQVEFKSYDAGRKSFQGTERSIWLDEECPIDIYVECMLRTATGDNIMMLTFTPLNGLTEFITNYIDGPSNNTKTGDKGNSKWLQRAGWADVPHLDEATKANIRATTPEHQRQAREEGEPILGSGSVFPQIFSIFIDPIPIPLHFRRCFGLDYGWDDPTAILWAATDPESNTTYIYAEHYLNQQPPSIHASVIKQRNQSANMIIPGVADPSGGGKSGNDGKLMRDRYDKEYDIKMELAVNSIEPGISKVCDMVIAGQLKIFNTCTNFINEYKLYRRVDGKLFGKDHLMDVLRYVVMSGLQLAKSKTELDAEQNIQLYQSSEFTGMHRTDSWLYD